MNGNFPYCGVCHEAITPDMELKVVYFPADEYEPINCCGDCYWGWKKEASK